MIKKIYCFIIFTLCLIMSPFIVEAKSFENEVVSVEFGNEDTLNLKYSAYNTFAIEEDKSFYYNGNKYYISDRSHKFCYL